MKYQPRARPFWEKNTAGPITEWQNARDRAILLAELRELKDMAERLDHEVKEAKGTSQARLSTVKSQLKEVDGKIDLLRARLGKPKRLKKSRAPVVVRRSVTPEGGSYSMGGDGNGNVHVQACAPRS